LALIWGLLMFQLPFNDFSAKAASSACAKNTAPSSKCSKKQTQPPSCARTKCSKQVPTEEKNECETTRCNPLMSCPTGNVYLPIYSQLSIGSLIILKEKTPLVNDNRLSSQLTECFHPPEFIS
jgi:hypothetical protein